MTPNDQPGPEHIPPEPLPGQNGEQEPDGRIPEELRGWIQEIFPEEEVLRSLEEVNPEECRELAEFLDLPELERAAANEQAQRKR